VEHHPRPTTTIAILGCDTVVGRSLSVLLEGSGAHLLILTPRVDQSVREAFLGAMGKSTPQVGDMPVIALHTDIEEDRPEKEGVNRVPWPCETKVLVDHIEAALSVQAASTGPTTQSRTG
jgi:hypothetical protein